MKTKIEDLSFNGLVYALCKIEMPHLVWGKTIGMHHASNQIVVPELPSPRCYSPFSLPADFWPIIDREGISVGDPAHFDDYGSNEKYMAIRGFPENTYGEVIGRGESAWFAAMRCYLAWRMGNGVEIDLPEDLT